MIALEVIVMPSENGLLGVRMLSAIYTVSTILFNDIWLI
jgi:hypothetical protein